MRSRSARILFCTLILFHILSSTAFAEDMDYTVTPEETEEMEKSVSAARAGFAKQGREQDIKFISIADPELTLSYDREEKTFVYTMPGGACFTMTAPLGAISNTPLTLDSGSDAWIVSLLRDGISVLPEPERYKSVSEALASLNGEKVLTAEFNEEGEYLFHIRARTLYGSESSTADSFGSVRIVQEDRPLWINELFSPYGYEVEEAFLNGKSVEIREKDRLELKLDGRYEVIFKPIFPGLPKWKSSFRRDTKAPYLTFTPSLTGEPIKTAVHFTPSEEGAGIRVFLNNLEISLYDDTASADGDYRIIVSDATGNENEYEFRIRREEKIPVNFYIILTVSLLAMGLFIIITAHRRMRII